MASRTGRFSANSTFTISSFNIRSEHIDRIDRMSTENQQEPTTEETPKVEETKTEEPKVEDKPAEQDGEQQPPGAVGGTEEGEPQTTKQGSLPLVASVCVCASACLFFLLIKYFTFH